jgi:uncharacterized protein
MQSLKICLYSTIIPLLIFSSTGCSLNNKLRLLEIPDIRQCTSYTCGVSCAQAILNYYDIEERENILSEKFGSTEKDGTSPSQIKAGLESYGLVVTIKEDSTLGDLKKNINNKIPTMVAIQAWLDTYPPSVWNNNWGNGHWVIVIGMDDKNIYLEDPALLGSRGWVTLTEFLARWHDYTGDPPCCNENNKKWIHLSISVQGKLIEHPSYTHLE